MNVHHLKPLNQQIAEAVAAERRRCLDIIEELAAFAHRFDGHQVLCWVHAEIACKSEGKSA